MLIIWRFELNWFCLVLHTSYKAIHSLGDCNCYSEWIPDLTMRGVAMAMYNEALQSDTSFIAFVIAGSSDCVD